MGSRKTALLVLGCSKIDLFPVQLCVLSPVQEAVVVEVGGISPLAKVGISHQHLFVSDFKGSAP